MSRRKFHPGDRVRIRAELGSVRRYWASARKDADDWRWEQTARMLNRARRNRGLRVRLWDAVMGFYQVETRNGRDAGSYLPHELEHVKESQSQQPTAKAAGL